MFFNPFLRTNLISNNEIRKFQSELFLGVRDCLLMRLSISKVLRCTSWVLGIVYWILGCVGCQQAFPDLREHFIGSSECFFGAIGHLTFLPETMKYYQSPGLVQNNYRQGQTWNLSQNLHGQFFSIICLPDKRVNYDKVTFATKQCILYIQIVSHIKYNKRIQDRKSNADQKYKIKQGCSSLGYFYFLIHGTVTRVQLPKGQNTPKQVGLQGKGSSRLNYLGFDYPG